MAAPDELVRFIVEHQTELTASDIQRGINALQDYQDALEAMADDPAPIEKDVTIHYTEDGRKYQVKFPNVDKLAEWIYPEAGHGNG